MKQRSEDGGRGNKKGMGRKGSMMDEENGSVCREDTIMYQ